MEMFYQYVVTGIQVLSGFYFFVRFLHKAMVVGAILGITAFYQGGGLGSVWTVP